MERHAVYLEVSADGRCMAHVLDLPGCFVRAQNRDAALSRAPAAIRECHAWLRRHGEPAPPDDEPIELHVAGEVAGIGPFEARSAAALFAPEREPIALDELEWCVRLMSHARLDLLALVHELPNDVLEWQPDPDSFSIRRLLRHVGNGEKWYVSRIAPEESLPAEWERDEELSIFEFLEMERRTAVERLRQLSDEERAGVFTPVGWTDHPEEPWTARKVLRRFLEHEREHTAQAREILLAWWAAEGRRRKTGSREVLLAALWAARQELLAAANLVPPDERASRPVCGDWTLKDVLAHVADWEWVGAEGLRDMADGQSPEVEHIEDIHAWNQRHYEMRRGEPWEQIRTDLQAARDAMVGVLQGMDERDLARPFTFPWGSEGAAYQWVGVYVEHDREHAHGAMGA